MKNYTNIVGILCLVAIQCAFQFLLSTQPANTKMVPATTERNADDKPDDKPADKKVALGAFSVSLSVKDIQASKAFYEKLDFVEAGGNIKQNWLIMRNGTTTIGLFQGMFEKNMMTFNPGWNQKAEAINKFVDVRELQAKFKSRKIDFKLEAKADSKGPASFLVVDPDGNSILFDQHVPKPN